MTIQSRNPKIGVTVLAVLAVVVTVVVGWAVFQTRRTRNDHIRNAEPLTAKPSEASRALPESIDLSEAAVQAMRLKTVIALIPRFSKIVHLRGSLQIDPNRQSHVHARFAGQIVELAKVPGVQSLETESLTPPLRELQNFDVVERGFPMAIIWSKDLGEKKSQLADSLARLRLERQTLKNYKELTKDGSIADREYREQQTKVEQLQIATISAEATLRAYQVDEAEIKQVKDSAEKFHTSSEVDKAFLKDWPRVVVTAPMSGVIAEKNVTVGDIVDANADLFRVADIKVLAVWLHAYEEDLPALEQLPKPLRVFIKVPANPELGQLEGDIDRFSPLIDPNEHMALLIGTVNNLDGKLRSNQFITADVGIPVEKGVVEIPTNAMIDVGNESIVYVQTDASKLRFHRRSVKVIQRYFDVVYVRSELTDQQKQAGLHEVHVGDAVVAGGLLELDDQLQQLQ